LSRLIVNQLAGGDRRLDRIEEADEFLVAMTLHATAEHGAIEHVECGHARSLPLSRRPGLLGRCPVAEVPVCDVIGTDFDDKLGRSGTTLRSRPLQRSLPPGDRPEKP
jgi:hypothetical protein